MKRLAISIFVALMNTAVYAGLDHSIIMQSSEQSQRMQERNNAAMSDLGNSLGLMYKARKAKKEHEKAMAELSQINLDDKQAVILFVQKYPNEIEYVKQLLELKKGLN
nr:hypothetical protein [Moraxella sp. CTOTU47616]